MVQFEHRMVAYMLFVIAILHAIDAVRSRAGGSIISGACWLAGAVAFQAMLGILTLLNQVPINLALAHQGMAIAVLTLAVFQTERLTRRPEQAAQHMVRPVAQTG
jgi:heme a synthase